MTIIEAITAADSGDHSVDTSLVIVALPTQDDSVNSIGDEQKHVTLVYLGDFAGDAQAVNDAVALIAEQVGFEFTAEVSGIGTLGAHPGADTPPAQVWLVESAIIEATRHLLIGEPSIAGPLEANRDEQHPHFVPHVTIGYDEDAPVEAAGVAQITFDRLAVWQGDSQTEYTLGDVMPPETDAKEPKVAEPVSAAVDGEAEPIVADTRIPWHGVLAPEGVMSGDKRMFTNLGRTRPLPLPLTWQKTSADGHDQNVTVAQIEKTQMIDGLMQASGHFISNVEADEVIGLIAEFGRFGVSVDADDIVGASFDEDTESMTFDDPRVCAACIVPIPAFHEAYVTLGPHPILDAEDVPAEDALAASVTLADLAPGKTEDGPGWLTNPVDTDRLRDYWVRGEGAAKIGWGVPGDFNRCRVELAQYVKPQYLSGYCANRHYDALGVWPGRESSLAASADTEEFVPTRPALTLIASAVEPYPAEWFVNPNLTEPTGVVITDDGRTYGHVATWGVCHIGIGGDCTAPPESETDYAYFATGEVLTTEGAVRVGNLTAGIGHANDRAGIRPAAAHYDNTNAVWADVAIGQDEVGIWFAGAVRPFAPEELVYAARAAGRVSGDWRKVRLTNGESNFELVGALAINVAGFPTPHMGLVAGAQVSLIAAGTVQAKVEEKKDSPTKVSEIASAVVDEMEARVKRRDHMAALMERVKQDR